MTFDKFNRRTHLYVGLTLLPWFFMYGLSSIPFVHRSAPAKWTVRSERAYSLPPIETGANLDVIGDKLIEDCGLNATPAMAPTATGKVTCKSTCPVSSRPPGSSDLATTTSGCSRDAQFRPAANSDGNARARGLRKRRISGYRVERDRRFGLYRDLDMGALGDLHVVAFEETALLGDCRPRRRDRFVRDLYAGVVRRVELGSSCLQPRLPVDHHLQRSAAASRMSTRNFCPSALTSNVSPSNGEGDEGGKGKRAAGGLKPISVPC